MINLNISIYTAFIDCANQVTFVHFCQLLSRENPDFTLEKLGIQRGRHENFIIVIGTSVWHKLNRLILGTGHTNGDLDIALNLGVII